MDLYNSKKKMMQKIKYTIFSLNIYKGFNELQAIGII